MKLVYSISPLPFYEDVVFQNHRKDYAYGQIYPLVTYRNMLMPFQIIVRKGNAGISRVYLRDAHGEFVANITDSMRENGLTITPKQGYNLIKYPGVLPIVGIVHEGQYYLEILLGGNVSIYSDIFSVCNNVDSYALLEYSNSYSFFLKEGEVDFSDNFKFRCYLDTQIGKPEYDFEEETTERMGYSFIESQVSKKIYKFTFIAPEYLCDALRLVRLCDDKRITDKQQEYDLTTFSMEPKWQDQGDLAAVECEFETDTIIANAGGYSPRPLGGDFDNDYNNDYDIQ